jgi:hypothetical protein
MKTNGAGEILRNFRLQSLRRVQQLQVCIVWCLLVHAVYCPPSNEMIEEGGGEIARENRK